MEEASELRAQEQQEEGGSETWAQVGRALFQKEVIPSNWCTRTLANLLSLWGRAAPGTQLPSPPPASVLLAQRALRDPSSGSLDLRVPPNRRTHSALGRQHGLRSPPPPRLLTCGPQEDPEHPEETQHPEELHGSGGAAEAGSGASASPGTAAGRRHQTKLSALPGVGAEHRFTFARLRLPRFPPPPPWI